MWLDYANPEPAINNLLPKLLAFDLIANQNPNPPKIRARSGEEMLLACQLAMTTVFILSKQQDEILPNSIYKHFLDIAQSSVRFRPKGYKFEKEQPKSNSQTVSSSNRSI